MQFSEWTLVVVMNINIVVMVDILVTVLEEEKNNDPIVVIDVPDDTVCGG